LKVTKRAGAVKPAWAACLGSSGSVSVCESTNHKEHRSYTKETLVPARLRDFYRTIRVSVEL